MLQQKKELRRGVKPHLLQDNAKRQRGKGEAAQ